MGKTIHDEARNMILKVLKFFESEKANKRFIIPVDQVIKRTCAATGISKTTLMKIKREVKQLEADQAESTSSLLVPRTSVTPASSSKTQPLLTKPVLVSNGTFTRLPSLRKRQTAPSLHKSRLAFERSLHAWERVSLQDRSKPGLRHSPMPAEIITYSARQLQVANQSWPPRACVRVHTRTYTRSVDHRRNQEVADTRHEQPEEPEQFVRCGLCSIAITGFVYACVQCGERACGACDAQRRHTRHHVMRAPCGSNENDVEVIVSKVREALSSTTMRHCDSPDDAPTLDSDENGYAEIKIEVDEGDLQTAYEDRAAGAASQIVPEAVEVKIEAFDPLSDPPPTKKRKPGDPPPYPNRSTKEDQHPVKQEPSD